MNTLPRTLVFLLCAAPWTWLAAQEPGNADEYTISVEDLNTRAEPDPVTPNVDPVPVDDDPDAVDVDVEVERPDGRNVDDILAELEEEEAGAEPVPEVEAPESPEVSDPTALPAMSLEEAESVEGLDIEGDDVATGLITINYEDVKLADMVRIFAQTSGANIIIPEGLDEPVSGNLNDVYWREALEVILEARGYALVERKAGIFTITPKDQLAAEPLASETINLKFISADKALPAVQSLIVSSNASVTPLPTANVLIVSETPQRLQEIKRVVDLVDIPRRQVFIEAKFVELNDSAIKDLGINWQVLQGYTVRATGITAEYERTLTQTDQDAQVFNTTRSRSANGVRTVDDNNLTPPVDTDQSLSTRSSGDTAFEAVVQGRNFTDFNAAEGTITTVPRMEQTIMRQAVLSADDFALTLSALQQLDGVRIVSNPKMLVANGETATIHVGRNEPNIRAVPQGENATTFAYVLDGYIEIGVKLEVTPVISTEKNITVGIVPELSRLIGQKEVGEAGTSFPITSIRRINTEFALESGKTVAIGGLTQSEESEEVNKIPLLGDLPIIGKYLFRHTSTETVQDEIIIFVSVKTAHTEQLGDRDGIPEQGKLIHTWLDQYGNPDQDR